MLFSIPYSKSVAEQIALDNREQSEGQQQVDLIASELLPEHCLPVM